MPCDFFELPNQAIRSLIPYQPGKSIAALQQELGLTDVIKLASNENPLGCSPKVHEALCQLSVQTISTYPAPTHHPLHQQLATFLHVSPAQLLLTNGSDALFSLLMNTFVLHTDKHMLTHDYAFNAFTIQAQALGVTARVAPVHADWTVHIDKLIEAITPQTGLILIANPNNPTGLAIPQSEVKRLLTHVPESTLCVLDEAYFEYHPQAEQTIDWLKTFPNLVILRTFSKAYGLAGLRLGYALAHPDIIQLLQRVQLPFTVNQAVLHAAQAALGDTEFIQRSVKLTNAGRADLPTQYTKLGVTPIPSSTNFITIDCHQPAIPIYEKLLHQGVIVRPLASYGLTRHLRITIGTAEQNQRLLTALSACI